MKGTTTQLSHHHSFCKGQKELDEKTLKAYRFDLRQFHRFVAQHEDLLPKTTLETYYREKTYTNTEYGSNLHVNLAEGLCKD